MIFTGSYGVCCQVPTADMAAYAPMLEKRIKEKSEILFKEPSDQKELKLSSFNSIHLVRQQRGSKSMAKYRP
jgi:hypothetical protein